MIRRLSEFYAASGLGQAIRNSSWAFAVVEMGHLVSLALLGGGLLVAAFGLAGWGLQLPQRFDGWRGLRSYLLWTAGTTMASGILLVGSNPLKYYFNDAFRAKMLFLAAGAVLAAATDLAVRRSRLSLAIPSGLLTLAAWLSVALAGRLIGLL